MPFAAGDGDDLSTKRVVVDSRDRDVSMFPTPADYEIEMDDEMVDVESVQLLVADVPFTGYLVNAFNRLVHFTTTDASRVFTAALTVGDYVDAAELATEIETRLNAACHDSPAPNFVVAYVPRTDNFLLTASTSFVMVFMSPPPPDANATQPVWERPRPPPPRYMPGTAARMMGFGCASYPAVHKDSSWTLGSPFRKNFVSQPYLVLRCEPAKVLTSSNNVIMDAFAVLSPQQNRLSFSHRDESTAARKTFSPIIPKLRRLRIRFIDYDGNPYNFQNFDHRFELIFKSKRSLKYRRFESTS